MLSPPGDGLEPVAPRYELRARLQRMEVGLRQWAAWAPKRRPPPTLSRPSLLQLREQLTAELERLDAGATSARVGYPRRRS